MVGKADHFLRMLFQPPVGGGDENAGNEVSVGMRGKKFADLGVVPGKIIFAFADPIGMLVGLFRVEAGENFDAEFFHFVDIDVVQIVLPEKDRRRRLACRPVFGVAQRRGEVAA